MNLLLLNIIELKTRFTEYLTHYVLGA